MDFSEYMRQKLSSFKIAMLRNGMHHVRSM